jgi:hypothetical protein
MAEGLTGEVDVHIIMTIVIKVRNFNGYRVYASVANCSFPYAQYPQI